jgi:hypothetical protein
MTNFQKILGLSIIIMIILIGSARITRMLNTEVEYYPNYVEKNTTVSDTAVKEEIIIPDSIILSGITGTYYNPVESQCDGSPLITADGSKINVEKLKNNKIRWVALSRNLLQRWGGPFNHGDTIDVYHSNTTVNGKWVVHDVMNKRAKNKIDFLVALGNKFPGKTRNIIIKKEI